MTTESTRGLRHLIDAHPLLFRGSPPDVPSHVPPGWYALIDQLCTDIEAALGPEACGTFEVRQIKEKFAELCFYYRLGESEDRHIDMVSTAGYRYIVGGRRSGGAAPLKPTCCMSTPASRL